MCRGLHRLANPAYLKGFPFSAFAQRCTVLRSQWCQSGVTNTLASTFAFVHPTLIGGYRTTQSMSLPLALAFSYASLRLNELPLRLLPKRCKTFAQALLDICRPVMQSY